jgi:hypothetical protein
MSQKTLKKSYAASGSGDASGRRPVPPMSYAQVLEKLQKEMTASSKLQYESNRLQKDNDSLRSQLKEKGRLLDSKDRELQLASVKANAEIAKLNEKLKGAYK